MSDTDKTVFISYRRNISGFTARAIFQDLKIRRYKVFMDVESLDSGTFDTKILAQIAAREHFIVILTPGSLERCNDPSDWLRREIEFAIEKQRNIVPVMVEGFDFRDAKPYLTGKLADLERYNGLRLSHELFPEVMSRLRKHYLKHNSQVKIEPLTADEVKATEQRMQVIEDAPAPTPEQLSAEQFFERGHQKWEEEDWDGAIGDCSEAIRLNPDFAEAYNRRGTAYYFRGDWDLALIDYEAALRINPQFTYPYNNRALVFDAQSMQLEAIAELDMALKFNPSFTLALRNRARIREKVGDIQGSLDDYEALGEIENRTLELWLITARLRLILEDFVGAIYQCTEAIKISPHPLAYLYRGAAYYSRDKPKKALADYKTFLHLGGDEFQDRGEVETLVQRIEQEIESGEYPLPIKNTPTIEENPLPIENALTLDDVNQKWEAVLNIVGQENSSVESLLRSAKVLAVEGYDVIVQMPNVLQLERLSGSFNSNLIEQALNKIFSLRLHIRPVTTENYKYEIGRFDPTDTLTSFAVNEMGGKVRSEDFLSIKKHSSKQLRVHMESVVDLNQNKRRIQRIFNVVTSYKGVDTFTITYRNGTGYLVEVDYPFETTRYCPSLIEALRRVRGFKAIEIIN